MLRILLILLPLCLAISLVYKTTKCPDVRQIPLATLVSWLTIVIAMFLVGAALPDNSEIGRYRMCCSRRGQFTEIFVIDTTNGVVKWYGGSSDGKPFDQVK